MPRPLRRSIEGEIYHVIMRGNNRRTLFHSTGEFYRFCQLMEEGINQFDHSLIAYCLMSNHVHLAVRIGSTSLTQVYHDLSFRYAQFYHHVHDSSGHVFQGRFKSIPVHTSAHLTTLIRYIHLNPVKAKIVDLPQQYRWSSHKSYLGEEEISWISPEIGLEPFDSDRRAFQEFVLEGVERYEEFDLDTGKLSIELEHLVNVVSDYYNLAPEAIGSTDRTDQSGRARSVIALLATRVDGIDLKDVAARFSRDHEAIRKAKTRLRAKLHSSPQIRAEVETIYNALFQR